MTDREHEALRGLLGLSAAGVLEPAEDRRVREHVRECPACSAELAALARLAGGLSMLPAPEPPADLALRTQARIAIELAAAAEGRHTAAGVAAGCMLAWFVFLAAWRLGGLWACLLTTIPAYLGAGVAAALLAAHRRLERSW